MDVHHDLLGCYANVWIRQKHFLKVGEEIGGHKHKYDHVSLLASGTVKIRVEQDNGEPDKVKEFTGPTFIIIDADKKHNVTALTEGALWYCIFANRDIEGNVYDPNGNCPLDTDCHKVTDPEDITIHTPEFKVPE